MLDRVGGWGGNFFAWLAKITRPPRFTRFAFFPLFPAGLFPLAARAGA